MVVHDANSSTQETEAGGSGEEFSQHGLHSITSSQHKQRRDQKESQTELLTVGFEHIICTLESSYVSN